MKIATIKTATLSLHGDELTFGALSTLVREGNAAHVPAGATVELRKVAGGYSAALTWTASVAVALAAEATS